MTSRTKQILAMSNSSAFFVEAPETPLLAQYLIGLTGKETPVIVHVGAANGDSSEKASKFFSLAHRAGFEPRHLNLFALEDGDPNTFFAGADAIYIDGGSTRNLRALLNEWSADEALRRAYEDGLVISGASAGANILFEWGMTDSIKTQIEATAGLGLLRGSASVHANVRSDRNEALDRHLAGANAAYPAYMLDDFTALHFNENNLQCAISTLPEAKVHSDNGNGERVAQPMTLLADEDAIDTI